jgi:hypothetical protein
MQISPCLWVGKHPTRQNELFMNIKIRSFRSVLFGGVALAMGWEFSLAVERAEAADAARARTTKEARLVTSSPAIPWAQIGAKAGAEYKGDGLAVIRTAEGARLRCVFQRLEAEATREGLWLTSTVTNGVRDRFRVMATAVEREASGRSADWKARSNLESPDGCEQTSAVGRSGVAADRKVRAPLPSLGTVSIDG